MKYYVVKYADFDVETEVFPCDSMQEAIAKLYSEWYMACMGDSDVDCNASHMNQDYTKGSVIYTTGQKLTYEVVVAH